MKPSAAKCGVTGVTGDRRLKKSARWPIGEENDFSQLRRDVRNKPLAKAAEEKTNQLIQW